MKKFGFTLAEVLITLGIIGVVAALTAPSLIQNVGSAQTGPKLAKAVQTIEVANENMINALSLNSITSLGIENGKTLHSTYGDNLTNYIKMSFYEEGLSDYGSTGTEASVKLYNGNNVSSSNNARFITQATDSGAKYITKDNFLYCFYINDAVEKPDLPFHKQFMGHVVIDINGLAEPNKVGKDVFAFLLYNDGSLRPIGSQNWREENDTSNKVINWKDGTQDKCNETTVTTGISCAGSIFENNLKVIYQ